MTTSDIATSPKIMKTTPSVSVIMPAFNSARHIAVAIESVLAQAYSNFELLVVDGGSADDTRRIVADYVARDARVRLVENHNDQGPAHARAAGIQLCRGQYVAFLDADDYWLPAKLDAQTQFMAERDIGFSYTLYRQVSQGDEHVGCLVPMRPTYDYVAALQHRGIGTLTVMLRRDLLSPEVISVWKRAGGEELLWWLLILRKGERAHLLPMDLARYRDTQGSLSKNLVYTLRAVWRMYHCDLGHSPLAAAFHYSLYALDSVIRKLRLKLCGLVARRMPKPNEPSVSLKLNSGHSLPP